MFDLPDARRLLVTCAAAWLVCAAVGCGAKPAPSAPAAATSAGAGPMPPSTIGHSSAPITEDEAREFAVRYTDAFKAGDLAAVARVLDLETLSKRCLEGVPLPTKSAEATRKGVQSGLTGHTGLVGQMKKALDGGGTYTLLHVHEVDGGRRVLLRMISPETGVNYHDVVLSKGTDGAIRGIDMYVFLTGELLSETMKRVFMPIAASENRSLIDKLAGRDQAFMRNFQQIASMSGAVAQQKPAEALRIFRSLPTEVQREKVVLITRLRAANMTGDETEYDRAIEDFRIYHPTDKCIDLMSIDYFFTRKEFDNVRRAIDRVDEAVGGDPYLHVMRANAFVEEGKLDEAQSAVRAAVVQEPELRDAWWTLVAIQLSRKAHDDVLTTLKEIDARFSPDWHDLSKTPTYAEFVKTDQHRQWLQHLERKKTP